MTDPLPMPHWTMNVPVLPKMAAVKKLAAAMQDSPSVSVPDDLCLAVAESVANPSQVRQAINDSDLTEIDFYLGTLITVEALVYTPFVIPCLDTPRLEGLVHELDIDNRPYENGKPVAANSFAFDDLDDFQHCTGQISRGLIDCYEGDRIAGWIASQGITDDIFVVPSQAVLDQKPVGCLMSIDGSRRIAAAHWNLGVSAGWHFHTSDKGRSWMREATISDSLHSFQRNVLVAPAELVIGWHPRGSKCWSMQDALIDLFLNEHPELTEPPITKDESLWKLISDIGDVRRMDEKAFMAGTFSQIDQDEDRTSRLLDATLSAYRALYYGATPPEIDTAVGEDPPIGFEGSAAVLEFGDKYGWNGMIEQGQ